MSRTVLVKVGTLHAVCLPELALKVRDLLVGPPQLLLQVADPPCKLLNDAVLATEVSGHFGVVLCDLFELGLDDC